MLKLSRSILDSARAAPRRAVLVLVLGTVAGPGLLAGCGQKGPLFLPTGAAAANRATLPETIKPAGTTTPPQVAAPAAAASAAR